MFNRWQRFLFGMAIAIVAAAVIAALWFTNRGQYRNLLEEHVANVTGHELQVAGAMELDLLPQARLSLEDARLRNPAFPQELASASRIELELDRGDLLRGELTITELRVEGFHINAFLDAAGNSIWSAANPGPVNSTGAAQESGAAATGEPGGQTAIGDGLPAVIVARDGRIDFQDLRRGRRLLMKNLDLSLGRLNLEGGAFPASADFELEWFDRANRRVREAMIGLSGQIEADGDTGSISIADFGLSSNPVLLKGRIDITDFPDNPGYETELAADEFNARVLLQNLGWLPEPESLSAPNGAPDDQWPAALAFELTGSANGFSASATFSHANETLIEAETEARFAIGLTPANVRYEMNIGEIDISQLFNEGARAREAIPVGGVSSGPGAVLARSGRELPGLENLNLSGSITADAIALGALRLANLTVYTNVENQVLDIEIPPAAALGGSVSANLRWNASSGELASELHGANLAITEIAPLITRLDVLTGNLHIDGAFNSNGRSVPALLRDLSGDASFTVTENLVNIGLIKQIFTSIAALSPSGEAIQQWPDLIRFSEVGGSLALDGGLGNEHSFDLRMDNFSARGTGAADPRGGSFDYQLRLTLLGDTLVQTIPVSGSYRDITWPVECSARFSDEVIQFCRPDFHAVREIFSRIGGDDGSN